MKSKTTYLAIAVGIGIIALAIFFTYSADQAKNRGQYYGDSLKSIQEEIKQTQTEFYSKKTMLDESTITIQDFVSFGNTHIQKMKEILTKYDTLSPPETFVKSTELFKASTQKQIESDESLIEWIATNDTSHRIRSDLLLQESFENEMAALASFNQAKNNAGQN
ncbi:hypothetical protein [Candidatus Nitrosotenuis cloacae]|uniref:Uncharacterized protein n=1 Tax=Candidatus Nitrosotenuis cloacae TaxID=1603555 RepID=A0A3G1B529_9ARCH|nr:hypothetical protein [Candidatus Nitrosotenuis cloacae]AJZ75081.1 hypothetical protein SU86_000235 [Candidatus Nitrosotenuis cloacae]